jgi:hypothetical protein
LREVNRVYVVIDDLGTPAYEGRIAADLSAFLVQPSVEPVAKRSNRVTHPANILNKLECVEQRPE